MKKTLFGWALAALLLGFGTVQAQTPVLKAEPKPVKGAATSEAKPTVVVGDSIPLTTMSIEHDTYDFGKIKQGDKVKHEFVFTNTGTNPLILENVKPSCGCTAIDWPKDPIPPGGKGKIDAQFNSAGKMGEQVKYITIVYNGNPKIARLSFTGEIIPADGATPAPAQGH